MSKRRHRQHKYRNVHRKLAALGISLLVIICCLCLYAYKELKQSGHNNTEKVNVEVVKVDTQTQSQEISGKEISEKETTEEDIEKEEKEEETEKEETEEETTEEVTAGDYVAQGKNQAVEENSGNRNVSLAVNVIYQYPDMPSGCEVTSLTMVLNYMGMNVTNTYLADNYLDSSTYDMFQSFVGNVYTNNSFGCFAPVIVNTANKYFEAEGHAYEAVDVSGSTKDELIDYLLMNKPVIIWNTEGMAASYIEYYNFDGYDFVWHGNEHCVVLSGYNEDNNTFEITDSIAGHVTRDADTFFLRYEEMLSQAVVINSK